MFEGLKVVVDKEGTRDLVSFGVSPLHKAWFEHKAKIAEEAGKKLQFAMFSRGSSPFFVVGEK